LFSRLIERQIDILKGDLHDLAVAFNGAAAAAFPVSKDSESATKAFAMQQETAEERTKLTKREEPSWQ
jgi:hypothetical protein